MGAQGKSLTDAQIEARHHAAHDLMSPARAVSIVADMLAVSLDEPSPDMQAIREQSAQLSRATSELLDRLGDYAEGSDG